MLLCAGLCISFPFIYISLMVGLTRALPAARQSYALARQLGYRSISSNSYVWRSSDNVARTGFRSVGIRREDKSRWERRSPLTPEAVKDLIQQTGAQVYIQPSTKRIFTDNAYAKVNPFSSYYHDNCQHETIYIKRQVLR